VQCPLFIEPAARVFPKSLAERGLER